MTKGSPDFKPAAWQRVTTRIQNDLPELSSVDSTRALQAVGADRARSLNRLDRYLNAHPAGLLTPTTDCPAVVVRLTANLAAAGYTAVVPLQCDSCGRRTELIQRKSGRICAECALHERVIVCARCGSNTHRVARLLPEGPLCGSCYARDPLACRTCIKCGRMRRPSVRLPGDEGVLCQNCAPRPQHTCIRCRQVRRAQCNTDDGPLCNNCYNRTYRSWACGLCGALRLRQSKTVLGPHVCLTCRRTQLRHAPPSTDKPPARPPEPREPRPRSTAVCTYCHRDRRVGFRWPAGPVCKPCGTRARTYPAECSRCRQSKALVGLDDQRRRICGPCAGWSVDYHCRACRQPGVASRGVCNRCLTRKHLAATFADHDGAIPDQLQPLIDGLTNARDPRSVSVWLGKSGAAAMLAHLARSEDPITHATLDNLSPSRHADYIREILVRTGILESRNEYLERLIPWIDRYLAEVPDESAPLLRAYAHWYLLHRARRRKRPLPLSGAAQIRLRVRVAHEFLEWIGASGHTLEALRQDHVDAWLARGTSRNYEIRQFLHWANQRGLTTGVSAPAAKPQQPSIFIAEDEHLAQLHRCLTDTTMDLDLRAGGALILLYGINVTRVVAIKRSQVVERSGAHFLNLADHDLLLPPALADLLVELPSSRPRSTLPEPLLPNRLLFPGRTPNRPVGAAIFGKRLKRLGIDARGGRNTAFIRLAADLPAAVIADLLAVDPITATRWAKYSKRDWLDYVAERDAGSCSPSLSHKLDRP